MLRICKYCGKTANTESELELFAKEPRSFKGRLNICLDCKHEHDRNYKRIFRTNNPQLACERSRLSKKKHAVEENKRDAEYRKKYPEINNAEHIAQRLVPLGDHCVKCGSTEYLQRHHPDYNQPLQIETLCAKCHNELHHEKS